MHAPPSSFVTVPLPSTHGAPPHEHAARANDEFFPGASEWPATLNRRDFVKLMGASLALAGLSGCKPSAPDRIVPRTTSLESAAIAAGEAESFATAISFEGYARGILVTSHAGRPTKIEGNPEHAESLGATDVFAQTAILSLYDPDRSPSPRHEGKPASWTDFETAWHEQHRDFLARRGAGLVLLTEPTTSPTFLREVHRVLEAFPAARWFQHTPLARYDHSGVQTDYDFSAADVILTIESDCFYQHPAALRYARALAQRRRITDGKSSAPRFYALEASPSVSGALADFRLPASADRQGVVLNAVARALEGRESAVSLSADEQRFVRALAADVRAHPGRVACIAGDVCDAAVRDWAAALAQRFGQQTTTHFNSLRSDSDPRCAGDLAAFVKALDGGEVRAAFILGGNPAYTATPDLAFASALRRVPFTVHLGEYYDETGILATWHLPESHFLEAWGDLRDFRGTASIQQPLIQPLHASRSASELLRLLTDPLGASAYDLVRETWRGSSSGDEFERRWHEWLTRGAIGGESSAIVASPAPESFPVIPAPTNHGTLTLEFRPDPNIRDGRDANNAWLQELPKPLTSLVWENAALVSAQLATELSLVNGDLVACEVDGHSLDVPVWIMPGQAATTVTLSLGYGRTHAGSVGTGLGYNAFALRSTAAPWRRTGATLRKLGRRQALVSTQEHFAMEGRDLVRVVSPDEAGRARTVRESPSSLFSAWKKDRYAWGMSIDLGTCLGCNACVIACQAENNIPVVGKEQVARGREMHWLRIDRYYAGEPANPRFLQQPVPCMQCENAPCEVVCPVAATVHSSEGLNDMVYNRCIGTRYCSNNCPYKVRRFNFFDYRSARDSSLQLQKNPDVTIRERGVMEKCTYCVQRINAGRIAAEKENRAIRDGEIRTACQQACPAEAIVFGDLNDPTSRVVQRKAEPANYALLEELNTRPRTTYLAAVRHAALT